MNSAVRVLAVRDLQVRFGSEVGVVHAVRGVDLTLAAGRTLGLVGESGSGKSAIGLAIMGLLPAHARTQGSVRLAGTELLGLDDVAMSRHRGVDLGMVFQDPAGALTPVLTVGAQVEEALRIHGVPRRAAAERALALLELVGLLDPRRAALAYPHELSGGQRQRVAIAIAVANEPAVVIADEPTTALDTCVQAQVLRVLRHTTRELGAALLLITHDLAVVAGLADDVAVIREGRIVELAPAQQLYAAPAHPYTRRLLRATPRIDSPSAPRTLSPPTPRRPLDDTTPLLQVRGLDVDVPDRGFRASYLPWRRSPGSGRRRIVTDVNLQVGHGECLALVGESGSGKSSTLAAIMDLDPRRADAARITLAGRPIRDRADVRERLHPAVQLVFQDAGAALDPRLTVAELVGEPLLVAGLPRADRTRTVRELLERVGLDAPILSRFSAQLSGGQRQRVAIARALATTPRLLLLDEPVSALDVCVQADILDLLETLRAELGLAYVFVAHDLAVVHRLADRVAVMYAGRIVETGPVQALLASPRHPYTRALVSAVPIPDPMVERSRRAIALPEPAPEPAGRVDSSAVVDGPPGSGCPVVPRCPLYPLLGTEAAQTCRRRVPQLEPVALEAPGPAPASTPAEHEVACHHPAAATSLLPLPKPAGRQLGWTP